MPDKIKHDTHLAQVRGMIANNRDNTPGDKVLRPLFFEVLQLSVDRGLASHQYETVWHAIQARFVTPFQMRANASYFTERYRSGRSFFAGVAAGPGLCLLGYFLDLSFILLPAMIEFSRGIYALLAALMHKISGEDDLARKYAKDGLARLLLSPCLTLLSVLALPIELVRFVTRSVATIVDVVKSFQEKREQSQCADSSQTSRVGPQYPSHQFLHGKPVVVQGIPVGQVVPSPHLHGTFR